MLILVGVISDAYILIKGTITVSNAAAADVDANNAKKSNI